jgi:hypothetical protein
MAWIIEIRGGRCTSDDFTLEDLGAVEASVGQPWSLLNPLASIPTAREFARVALRMQGVDDVDAVVDSLTAKDIRQAFTFESDVPIEVDEEDGDPAPLDLSTRSSSRGARDGTAGGRAKRAKSA